MNIVDIRENTEKRYGGLEKSIPIWMSALIFMSTLAPSGIIAYQILPYSDIISLTSLTFLSIGCMCLSGTQTKTIKLTMYAGITILSLALFYSVIFYINAEGDIISSFLSQRWFLYWIMFPALLSARDAGYSSSSIMNTLLASFIFIMVSYVYRQYSWDLEAIALSGDPELRPYIRDADGIRGFRLYFPKYIMFFYFSLFLSYLLQKISIARIVPVICMVLIISIGYSRLSIFYFAISLFLTLIFSPNRLSVDLKLFFAIILAIAAVPLLVALYDVAQNAVANDGSGAIRLRTLGIIAEHIQKFPVFGYGVDSARYSPNFDTLFGKTFSWTDVGLVGVTFVYGLAGLLLYLCISLNLLTKSIRVARQFRFLPAERAVATSCILTAFMFLISSVSFVPYVSPDGILTGAILAFRIADLRAKAAELG